MNAQDTNETIFFMDQKEFLFETYFIMRFQAYSLLQTKFPDVNDHDFRNANIVFATKLALANIIRENNLEDEFMAWKDNHENVCRAARRTKDYSKKK